MKRAVAFLVAGLLLGELDPIGRVVWQVLELRLPSIQDKSLASPSPFSEMSPSTWIAESENAYVQGGDQQRVRLLPLLWGRLTHLGQAA